MTEHFDNDIKNCISVLAKGGLILYPTDTIWGIGCDATNEKAVKKVIQLKQREESKSMIILVDRMEIIHNYVSQLPEHWKTFLHNDGPTTIIYDHAKNVAKNLVSKDGTIAIRIVKDLFCGSLIKTFNKPIVSTSANIAGKEPPKSFKDIDEKIKSGVDYIVYHRRNDLSIFPPSAIIKFNADGTIQKLR